MKALRRPTAAAALANRLAHERAPEVGRLLAAGDALRTAHSKGGADLRSAAEDERKAVETLVAEARKVDPGASDATLARVGSTLRAASADPEARQLLERGRLAIDVESHGFDALAGMQIAAPGPAAPRRPQADRRRLEAERARVRELRDEAAAARRAANDVQREAERAEREVAKAEERLRKLEER